MFVDHTAQMSTQELRSYVDGIIESNKAHETKVGIIGVEIWKDGTTIYSERLEDGTIIEYDETGFVMGFIV